MTLLDPPAAAARRQNCADRIAELLVAYGCPENSARGRAGHILDVVADHGYALPVALDDAPLTGHGSTPEGRANARRILQSVRAGCTCGRESHHLPVDLHAARCPLRTEDRQQPADPAAAAPEAPGGHPDDPDGLRHGPDGVTEPDPMQGDARLCEATTRRRCTHPHHGWATRP